MCSPASAYRCRCCGKGSRRRSRPAAERTTIAKHFSDKAEAYKLIERIRWPNGKTCPHCGTVGRAYFLTPKDGPRTTRKGTASDRRIWKCAACCKKFSVLVGTIFEDSKVPLSKWLLTIHLTTSGKNSVSAYELHHNLGVTYKTAWFMAHRIRKTMEHPPLADEIGNALGVVEAAEAYIGGKAKNMHRSKRESGAALNKIPVVTLVERNGEAHSEAMEHVC